MGHPFALRNRLGVRLTLEERTELAVRLHQDQRGQILALERGIRDRDHALIVMRANKERQAAELEQAGIDPLTGTGSLLGLQKQISIAMRAFTGRKRLLTVGWFDLDGLGALNLEHGLPRGSQAIAQVGAALQAHVGNAGSISRIGGDDFVGIFPDMRPREVQGLFRSDPGNHARFGLETVLTWEDEQTGEVVWAQTRQVTVKGAITRYVPGESLTIPGTAGAPVAGAFERTNYGWERAKKQGGDMILVISPRTRTSVILRGERRKFGVEE